MFRVFSLYLSKDWLLTTILFILSFALFANSIFNDFVLDDITHIVKADVIHSLDNAPRLLFTIIYNQKEKPSILDGYYRGLMFVTFSLIYAVGGAQPQLFHLSQILLHGANTIMLFYLYQRFFKRKLAFLLALIFLAHPSNQEAVVYVSSLQDVLFFFFGIAGLLICTLQKNPLKYVFLSSEFLLLSLLSKETAVLFIILAVLYVAIYKNAWLSRYILVYSGSVAVYLVLRTIASIWYYLSLKPHDFLQLTLTQKLLYSPWLFTYYLRELVLPSESVPVPSTTISSTGLTPLHIIFFIFVFTASVIYLGKILWQKDKLLFKAYLFFLAWFLMGIAFHLHLVTFDAVIAKRWLYFPIAGFLGIICVWLQYINPKPKSAALVYLFLMLIAVIASLQTVRMNTHWQNGKTLAPYFLQ